jgi:tape measure domain-containing protein
MAKARIDITGNSQSFEQAARRVNVDLMKMNSNAQETGQAMSAFGNKTKAALAGIVSTAAITAFLKNTATIRGQFQQYEIALSTMLQSEEKAAALMGELVGLAAKTPFDLQGVVEGAKQLMAYGTAAEDMTETLTMLGDVAAGLSIPLGDLVYLYGTTMTQGRMYTMDLRQFMARGIPMAEELAKQFGVTKDAVSELVTEGKVGAEDMKKALQSMTSEGGKFHNLMEAQSASITGQLSNLTDKIQTAYNKLGKKNEGIIYDAIKGASYLVGNYEEIGKAIVELIVVYGSYKAALIAVTAAHRAYTLVMQQAQVEMALAQAQGIALSAAQAKMAATTKILSGAMSNLNKVIKANPYALLAAAVIGLGYGIYKLATYQTDYQKSLKKLKETQDGISSSMNEELLQLDILYKRLEKATEGSAEYLAVKEEISSKYGNYLQGLKDEKGNVLEIKDAYEKLTEKIVESARARAMTESLKSLSDDLVKAQTKAFDQIDKALEKKFGKTQGAEYARQIKLSLVGGEEFDQDIQAIIDSLDEVYSYNVGGEWRERTNNELKLWIDNFKKVTDKYKDLTNEVKSDFVDVAATISQGGTGEAIGPLLPDGFDRDLGRIKTAGDLIRKAKKNVSDLNKELASVKANPQQYTTAEKWAEAIADVSKRLKEAKDVLSTLTGTDDGDWKKIQKEYKEWLVESSKKANEELVNLQLQQEKDRVNAMEDGAAKRKAQFELEQKESLVAMQKYVRDVVDEQAKLAKNQGKSAGYGNFEVGVDGTLAYNLAKSGLTPTAEQQAVINKMVQNWNQRIIDTWVKETTTLDLKSGYNLADELIEKLDQELIAGLAKGGFNPLKQQASIIFADISELSSGMIQQIIANAEKYLKTPGLTDEAVAEYRRAIDKANEYLVENNPWEAIKVAQERYVKAIADYNKAKSDYDEAKQAGDIIKQNKAIGEQNAAILEQASALSIIRKSYEEIGSLINELSGYGGQLAEIFGVDSGIISSIKQMIDGAVKLGIEIADITQKSKEAGENAVSASKSVTQAANDTGDSIKQVGATSGSAIVAIIGAVIQIGAAIANIIQTVKEEQILKSLNRINKAIGITLSLVDMFKNRINPGDSFFTEDLYNDLINLNNALSAAIKNVSILWSTALGKMPSGLSYVTEELRKMFAGAWDEFSGFDTSQFFNVDINKLQQYITTLESAKAGASEAVVEALEQQISNIEQIIDLYNEMHSKVREIAGDISGNMLSSVNAMWKQIREEGKITFEDLAAAAKKNTADVIDQMVSNQLWVSYMSRYFDQLGEGLTNAILQGGDADSIIGVFDGFWSGMTTGLKDYTAAYETFLKSAEAHGWDMSSTTTATVDTKAAEDSIKGMRDELSRLQEQWDNLTDAERKSKDGEELFGSIKDLEDKIEAAENLYSTTRNIAGSINDINSKLSELNAEWDSISPEDREGAYGAKIKADIAYYEQLLNDAESLHQSELASLQSLIDSKEAKYDLYQKWIELYGDETATRMMGDMLTDAEAYLNELRNGISELQEKVTAGTATDEEISQLSAWEQQYADIQRAAAEAAEEAAGTAYEAWNEALDKQLDKAKTDYEKLAVLQDEYLNAVAQAAVAQGTDKTYADQYVSELEAQIAQLEAEVESNLREKYKTEAQEREEALQGYKEDMEYAEQVLQDMDLVAEIRRQRDEYLSGLANVALESSEEYQLIFGDLQEVSADAFNAAMGNIRKTVEESTELTAEAKANLLKLLDEVQDKWNDLKAEEELDKVKEKFSDIQSIMGSVSGLLEEMGVSDTFSQMFSGLQTIIEGYGQLKVAIETARVAQTAMNMATAFGAIATIITGLIRSVGTLVNRIFTVTDIEGPLQGLVDTYDKLTKAIDRSVGAQRKARQEEAAQNLKDQKAELERDYAKEASKWGFSFTILGKKIQILGPDQGVLDELASQIEEVDAAMQQLGDTMKYDFLQTDYESFADSLSDILTQPYDSFEDMMNAVDDLVDTTLDRITQKWLTTNFLQGKIETALENLYAAGDPSAEAYERYRQAVKEASEYYLQEAEKLGIGTYSSGSANSDYDTIRRISAEDFSKWLGEWRAQRIALVDNGNVLKNIYDQLKTMSESPAADPELLELTRKIESNTAVLPEYLPRILEAMKGQNNLKAYGY